VAIYFLDSSALVKRYLNETGSKWVLDLFDPALDNEIFVAAITGVEIVAAITRRARGGNISITAAAIVCRQFRNDLQTNYQVVEINEEIINSGMNLAEARSLRGYDAVQLAAGCGVNTICIASGLTPVIFVSADNELNVAAASEGLWVENPNIYP
jgi:uncharacterized protein